MPSSRPAPATAPPVPDPAPAVPDPVPVIRDPAPVAAAPVPQPVERPRGSSTGYLGALWIIAPLMPGLAAVVTVGTYLFLPTTGEIGRAHV